MTDTKDDEVKQTAWEAGFEAGWKAAKKNDNYSKCYELYLMTKERRRRERIKKKLALNCHTCAYEAGYRAGLQKGRYQGYERAMSEGEPIATTTKE